MGGGGGRDERSEPLPKECKSCSLLKPANAHECPKCGFKPQRQTDIVEADGEPVELRGKARAVTMAEKQAWYSGLLWVERQRAYKPGWAENQYRGKFGVRPANIRREASEPTPEMLNYVKSQQIRFAKRRAS